jgi:hypothetical protein
VAVVVLTTYVDDSSVLAALQAGARSYLTKEQTAPISPMPCAVRRRDWPYSTRPFRQRWSQPLPGRPRRPRPPTACPPSCRTASPSARRRYW